MDIKRLQHCQQLLHQLKYFKNQPKLIELNGHNLSIPEVYQVYSGNHKSIEISSDVTELLEKNVAFLNRKIKEGCVIYGINTGYGGSADVRSDELEQVQKSLVFHLNTGFGDSLPFQLVRAVMMVRANSLCRGYSGVRPLVPSHLLKMIEKEIIPVVPKRGTISASGDLMPTSYIAACMMASDNAKVRLINGEIVYAKDGLKQVDIEPIIFQAKEALAVINAASFASTLAACVLFDANIAIFLTQVCTALSVESLHGRAESFKPTIHYQMPHPGQIEAAANIHCMLNKSKIALSNLEVEREDKQGTLKQDRYATRCAAQWLGPVLETVQEAMRKISIEINSVSDNPIIDHVNEEILHCGNFQGIQITVAMDQTRQSIQLCGKLLFGQMQEIVNGQMNNGLTPNLAGSNVNTDFGFKGMDTAMAAYMSELDYLTNNLTNHVLSAELHNQAINSMALVSARYTQQALEILQMMIVNILLTQVQAVDLRWMKIEFEASLDNIFHTYHISYNKVLKAAFPWFQFVFNTRQTVTEFLKTFSTNGLDAQALFLDIEKSAGRLVSKVKASKHVNEVFSHLGKGTKKLYVYIRKTLAIPFCDGSQTADKFLQRLLDAMKSHSINDTIIDILELVIQDKQNATNVSEK